ncbi:MAG: hypothetical protein ACYC69_02830 [Thermodesulfovibrionales bacterium]
MRRLELTYEIKNLNIRYEVETGEPVSWHEAEFIPGKDFTATLRLWKDGIEPEGILETRPSLEQRADSFRVALKYLGNHRITFEIPGVPTYYFGTEKFPARNRIEVKSITDYLRGRAESFIEYDGIMASIILSCNVRAASANIPQSMPTVPPDLHRMAETIVAADELYKYPDLVMKLAFMILEDLKGLNALDAEEVKMKYVRDFVSHPICGNPQLTAFVESELPSARATEGVQFRRNDKEHMAFVSKYASPALQRAKELFNEKVRTDGGFLRE